MANQLYPMPLPEAEGLLLAGPKRVSIGVIAQLLRQPGLTATQLARVDGFPGCPEPGLWDRRSVLKWLRRRSAGGASL